MKTIGLRWRRGIGSAFGLAVVALMAMVWGLPIVDGTALRTALDHSQGPLLVVRLGLYIVVVVRGPGWRGARGPAVRRARWTLLLCIGCLEAAGALARR